MAACYQGPDPYDNERGRMAIWAWAKKPSGIDPKTGREMGGGIDEGRSFDDVHDAINRHFYNGFAPPEWITDKLSGRKTPLKPFAMSAKIAEIHRRNITAQAKRLTEAISKQQKQGTPERWLRKVLDFPRKVAVGGHSLALAFTHPGDLAFQPRNMGIFWENLLRTWQHAFPFVTAKRAAEDAVAVENFRTNEMKKNANYEMALYSKLDLKDHGGNLTPGKGATGSATDRAWSMLQIARFKMWNGEYERWLKENPTADEEQKLAIGKMLAQMANHATGSSGGMTKEISPLLFGPKLTASKISRLIGDPLQTARTIFNKNATPEERYVANRRFFRATKYLGTLTGFLAANWGFNKATGTKDEDNVNFTNPARSDFLSFKTGGLEWSVPGMHTEIRFLANVLGIAWQTHLTQAQINKASRGQGQWGELREAFGKYALNKMVPGGQLATELLLGHDWQNRPLPFSVFGIPDQKGTKNAPPFGANPQLKGAAHLADATLEYTLSHAPIPFSGPIRFVYDQLRNKGASAGDAMSVIRGLALAGLGFSGLHAAPTYEEAKATQKRNQAAKALGH